jgi:hypothetical protein
MEQLAADAEWMLGALMAAGNEPVKRHRRRVAELAHR